MSLGMNKQVVDASIAVLTRLLADNYVLQVKTQSYHWHVEGLAFYALHQMFEQQYNDLADAADDIAERIRALGGNAIGTMAGFLEQAALQEDHQVHQRSDVDMCENLAQDHLSLVTTARAHLEEIKDLADEATIDLIVGRLREHDKAYWMLQASCR